MAENKYRNFWHTKEEEFFCAAKNGSMHVIDNCLKTLDINTEDENGLRAVHHAAEWRNFHVLRKLVERGASLAPAKNSGWTPLHFCCSVSTGKHIEMAKYLIEKRCDVNAITEYAETPISLAAESCYTEAAVALIRLLIEEGAKITQNANEQNPFDQIPYNIMDGNINEAHDLVQRARKFECTNVD